MIWLDGWSSYSQKTRWWVDKDGGMEVVVVILVTARDDHVLSMM